MVAIPEDMEEEKNVQRVQREEVVLVVAQLRNPSKIAS